jgi:hypothetical protein
MVFIPPSLPPFPGDRNPSTFVVGQNVEGEWAAWVYSFIIYQPTVTDWAFAVSVAGVNIKAKEVIFI